ncbi:MAG: hypothetical protein OXF98_11340, partial [Rhodospirillaceae bacterium]|nr:hypothetical protein [Rhodospirillaceae bacterium]
MRRYIGTMILGALGIAACGGVAYAQTDQMNDPDWPDWAYGFLTPLTEGDPVAPACPPTTDNPRNCRTQTPLLGRGEAGLGVGVLLGRILLGLGIDEDT